jgi:hypothetical protein
VRPAGFPAADPYTPADGFGECTRLSQEVARTARPDGLDDDFSLLVLTFG